MYSIVYCIYAKSEEVFVKKLLVILMLLATTVSLAQPKSYPSWVEITTFGMTKNNYPISCGTFLQDNIDVYKKRAWADFIAGYITAANSLRGRATRTDLDGMHRWLMQYCNENPTESLSEAFRRLDKTLGVGRYPVQEDKWK